METMNNEVILLVAVLLLKTVQVKEYHDRIGYEVPDLDNLEWTLDENTRTFNIPGVMSGGWDTLDHVNDILDVDFGVIGDEGEGLTCEIKLSKLKINIIF